MTTSQATVAQSNADLIAKLGAGNYNISPEGNVLPKNPTPSSTGTTEINANGSPAINPPISGITAAGAGATTQGQQTIDQLQSKLDELSKQAPTPEVTTEKKSIMDLITKRETTVTNQKTGAELRQEALTQAYKEMGVTPEQIATIGSLIGQVTSFNQQIANLKIQQQKTIDAVNSRPELTGTDKTVEINRATKDTNSQIAAVGVQSAVKTSELQMIQGAYTDAKQTATDIVNSATHDQAQKVADIEWSLNAHQDLYNLMTTSEQNAWTRQYNIAKDALDTAKTSLTNISKYVVDPATADAFKGTDWTKLSQTEAMDLVAKYTSSSAYVQKQAQLSAADRAPSTDGVPNTGGFDDTLGAAIKDNPNASAEQIAMSAFSELSGNLGIKVTYAQLLADVKRIKQGLPASAFATTPNATKTSIASTPVYGKGNFSKIPIDDRINQLKSMGGAVAASIKSQLIEDGYPTQEIVNRVGNIVDKAQNAGSSLLNKISNLFGK